MSALAGKRKRMGLMANNARGGGNGRAAWKPDYSPTGAGGGSSPPAMSLQDRKRANEDRRRGRQPKIRGMVGLQVHDVNTASHKKGTTSRVANSKFGFLCYWVMGPYE